MDGRLVRAGAAVAVAALASCSSTEVSAPASPTRDAVVRLLQDSLSVPLDDTRRLVATRTDADGHPAPARLRWRSGDESVATVDSAGAVTAVGLGRTWIEVSDTRHTDTAIVATRARYTAIQAGSDLSCALAGNGQAVCWGWNAWGSLGRGSGPDRQEPQVADGGHHFHQLTVGAASACGLADHLYCWGYNGVGQLGDGTIAARARPVVVADTLELQVVTLGAGTTACAFDGRGAAPQPGPARTSGTDALICWGWNGYDQLLDGSGVNAHKPKRITTGLVLGTIAPGGHHVCGLDAGGAAWCWGLNDAGQLGDGSFAEPAGPVAVAGGHRFAQLAAGIAHTCGREPGGSVWCWGSNALGQLGMPGAGDAAVPMLMAGGMPFETIDASANHTCALAGGEAWCWGDNRQKQLGHPDAGGAPGPVAGSVRFAAISAGLHHSCGVDLTGGAWCWGGNLHGQLGAATAADGYSPVRVGGPDR